MIIKVKLEVWTDLVGAILYGQDFKTDDVICKTDNPPTNYIEVNEDYFDFTQLCLPDNYPKTMSISKIEEGLAYEKYLKLKQIEDVLTYKDWVEAGQPEPDTILTLEQRISQLELLLLESEGLIDGKE